MKQRHLQPDRNDLRWDEVRALLPVVSEWLNAVRDLLTETAEDDTTGNIQNDDETTQLTELTESYSTIDPTGLMTPKSATKNSRMVPVADMSIEFDERQRLTSLFEQYLACQEEFTRPQWAVICLRFRNGHTQAEIGKRIGKSRSAVHGLLERARENKNAFQRKLRNERGLFAKKYLNQCE